MWFFRTVIVLCTLASIFIVSDYWYCRNGCGCEGPGCNAETVEPQRSDYPTATAHLEVPPGYDPCQQHPDGEGCGWVDTETGRHCRFVKVVGSHAEYAVVCVDRIERR